MSESNVFDVSVTRHLFFQADGHTLRFTEAAPPVAEPETRLCNCTKTTHERPAGEPAQRSHLIEIGLTVPGSVQARISNHGGGLTVRLTRPRQTPRPETQNERILYFREHDDRNRLNAQNLRFSCAEHGIRVDADVDLYGPLESFAGAIYFGNNVDFSRLMNGHSPSTVVERHTFRDDEAWMHVCDWGGEAVRALSAKTAKFWQACQTRAQYLVATIALELESGTSVDAIRASLLASQRFELVCRQLVNELCDQWLVFESSETFRVGAELDALAAERSKAIHSARSSAKAADGQALKARATGDPTAEVVDTPTRPE